MAFGWTGRNSGGNDRIDQGMITELRAYWEALREGDSLPRRDRVDPRGIAGALEHSFLIERIAPGIARFRISGMIYNDLMGMDIRGMPMSCLFLSDARTRLQMDLERVFRGPAAVSLDLLAERSLGRPALRGRMLILPMLAQDDTPCLAIGCLELGGEIGRTPRRFSITAAQIEAIVPQRRGDAPEGADLGSERADADATLPRLMEVQSAPARPPRAQTGIPHLRLVKS